jgi:ABC-type multidrug transport system ATPase subunit
MSNAVRQTPEIRVLQELLGGKFTGEVLWRKRGADVGDPGEWAMYSGDLEYAESNGDLYLNDFRLQKGDGSSLTLGNMSSGQKILLIRLLSVLAELEDESLVILEEPEMHLDPAWARQLISLLLSFFKSYNAHFLIATHSFSLLNAVPSDCILVAKSGQFSNPDFPTLLANESSLAEHFYHAQPHYVEEYILNFAENASREELMRVFLSLGESGARYDIYKRLRPELSGQN